MYTKMRICVYTVHPARIHMNQTSLFAIPSQFKYLQRMLEFQRVHDDDCKNTDVTATRNHLLQTQICTLEHESGNFHKISEHKFKLD